MKLYLKDYLTLGNVVCSVISMVFVVHGKLDYAIFAIWFAYIFDSLDGLAARLTGKQNSIGGHLDNTADLVGYAIAPALIIYAAYVPLIGHFWSVTLACVPAVFGTIRHARNYANPPEVTNLWCGLPRTYSGFAMICFIGSHLFAYEIAQWFGIILICVTSFLGITAVGYQGRHHKGLRWHQKMFFIATILTWVVGLVVWVMGYGLQVFFDGFFFWMFLYILLAWKWLIEPEEYEAYYKYIAEWKKKF